MNPQDPLRQLLHLWQPQSPHSATRMVQDVLQQICMDEAPPTSHHPFCAHWQDFLAKWLPSPQILIPVAACLLLLMVKSQWDEATLKGREWAALHWQNEIIRPMSPLSFTGSYALLKKVASHE